MEPTTHLLFTATLLPFQSAPCKVNFVSSIFLKNDMKRIIIFILLALTILGREAAAEASFEVSQNGLDRSSFSIFGAQVENIAVDSAGRAYVTSYSPNGFFCLDSGSTEWRDPPVGTDLGNTAGLAIGATSGTVFVIGGTSLFRSTDGCQSFTELTGSSGSAASNNYGFKIVFAHGVLLVENGDGTIDRSADNGDSFSKVTVVAGAEDVVDLASAPTAGLFYALIKGGGTTTVYRSADFGQSWGPLAPNRAGDFLSIAVDPLDPTRIAIATGSGDVQFSSNEGVGFGPLDPPDTSRNDVRFIGNRLYKGSAYTENMTDWSLLPATNSGANMLSAPVQNSSNTSELFSASELGVGRSGDGGATFGDRVNGLLAVRVHDIAQVAGDKNGVYLATEQGLAKTSNFLSSEKTWTFPLIINSTRPYQAVYSIHLDISNSNSIHAGLIGGNLAVSTDAGASWVFSSMDDVGGADILDIDQTADGTLYAAYASRSGNAGGVLQSRDSGASWQIISTGQISIDCNSLAVIGNNLFIGAGDELDPTNSASGVYKFDGSTFSKLPSPVSGQVILAVASAADVLIAASAPASSESGGVFRSANGGASWANVTGKGLRTDGGWYRTLAVDPTNPDIIYVAHGRPAGTAEIYYSQDRGLKWALLFEGLKDEVPEAMLVDALTIGSGVGFSGLDVRKSVTVRLTLNKRNVLATLKDGTSAVSGQLLSIEKKKGANFTRLLTKATNAKGVASFPLKKIKGTPKIRARFIDQTSKFKKKKAK